MSLLTNLQNLATRIATEFKAVRTLVNGNASDLSGLNTTAKANLVLAINEVNNKPTSTGGATNLDGLNDVEISSPGIGEILIYGAGSQWRNGVAPYQPLDSDLTAIAALSTTTFGRSLLTLAAVGDLKAQLSLAAVATSGSASDITTGVLPTTVLPPLAINDTFVVATQAAMLALTAQRGDMAIRTDNGRTYVLSVDDPSVLANWKEVLAAGQVQSVAGKTGVVVLTKADVGLANVDNTSDAAKPISTATQAALDTKVPTTRTVAGKPLSADVTLAKGDVGLGNVDNTSDANKPVSTATTTALNGKQPLNATLTSIAATNTASIADRLLYTTGPSTYTHAVFTAFARSLVASGDAATARGVLDVYSKAEIGDPETDLVAIFNAGLV